jgi:3-oxoacyl-[acyl-carrier-protein] synthase II
MPSGLVAIAGVGLATPLGLGVEATWDALVQGRFITDHSRTPIAFGTGSIRVHELALRVACEAVAHSGWTAAMLRDDATGLVVGTSKGAVEAWIETGQFAPTALGEVADVVGNGLGIGRGPRLTLASACASGLLAVIRGVLMIRHGEAQRVVVVGAESSLHPLFLASFQRLGVLPRPGVGCRPFDEHREGFLMSEATGAVCLELAGEGETRVCIDQIALGADAMHLTGGDPHGLTLRTLLKQVIAGQEIDLIHAHGTGTLINDPIELSAIESSINLQDRPPLLYSHKGALGHSLGAAGILSIALSALMHQRGIVPGNIQTTRPLPHHKVTISQQPQHTAVRRSIALAAGFGGAAAAVGLVSPRCLAS